MATARSSFVPLIALLTLIVVLAGCERMLDTDRVEAVIKSGLTEQLKMPFSAVSCPDSRAMKAADEFDCKATAETGGDLTIRVTQEDGTGNIKWKAMDGERVLSMTNLETQIQNGIANQLKVDAKIDCGTTRLRIAVTGQTLECTATAGSESRKVIVTVKDERGNVDWTMK